MQCEKFEIRLNELVDQRRRPESDAVLVEHAHECPACQEMLSAWDLLQDGLDSRSIPEAPEDLVERVFAGLSRPERPERLKRAWMIPLAIAAMLLVAALPLVLPEPPPAESQQVGFPGVAVRPQHISEPLPPLQVSPDQYLFRLTGQAMATLPDAVRRAAAPDESVFGQGIRPVTNGLSAAFNALLQTLPSKAESES